MIVRERAVVPDIQDDMLAEYQEGIDLASLFAPEAVSDCDPITSLNVCNVVNHLVTHLDSFG